MTVHAPSNPHMTQNSATAGNMPSKIPTIRKVRQALGRVVRSPGDYGARVLLDGRYTSTSGKRYGKYSVFKFFPEEERAEIIDVEPK
ncbi:Uncharacterised protein [uncultured archaeon]|nr:Uncharacterised protein [uncultured archaeon]